MLMSHPAIFATRRRPNGKRTRMHNRHSFDRLRRRRSSYRYPRNIHADFVGYSALLREHEGSTSTILPKELLSLEVIPDNFYRTAGHAYPDAYPLATLIREILIGRERVRVYRSRRSITRGVAKRAVGGKFVRDLLSSVKRNVDVFDVSAGACQIVRIGRLSLSLYGPIVCQCLSVMAVSFRVITLAPVQQIGTVNLFEIISQPA